MGDRVFGLGDQIEKLSPGFSQDRAWWALIVRLAAAGVGVVFLELYGDRYEDNLIGIAKLAASAAFGLFVATALIRGGKQIFGHFDAENRWCRGQKIWAAVKAATPPQRASEARKHLRDRFSREVRMCSAADNEQVKVILRTTGAVHPLSADHKEDVLDKDLMYFLSNPSRFAGSKDGTDEI